MKPIQKAYLDNHILRSNQATEKGLDDLYQAGIISAPHYLKLLHQQSIRHSDRLAEFRKLIRNALCLVVFVPLFAYQQISGQPEEMIRTGTRPFSRLVRARKARD